MEYLVKTPNDRNLVIEADSFRNIGDGVMFYNLASGDTPARDVAFVSYKEVFAIVENEAWKGDFYVTDNWDDEDPDDDTDDIYLDCRLSEFLDSEEFFDAVYDIVDVYHAADNGPETPPEPVKDNPPTGAEVTE